MTVENATYIHQLDRTLPTNVDLISEGDDHLRLLKKTTQNTFPNVTGAVSATHVEISYLSGVTSAIQAQINLKAAKGGDTYTGAHNFSGATLTIAEPPPGDSSQLPATTAFVAATAFSSALPEQTGNSGKILSTNGSTAGWVDPSITHTHPISQVTSLQTTLDGKAALSHTHTTAQVTGLDTALAGKAATSHTHTISNVTGLQTTLDDLAAIPPNAKTAAYTLVLGDSGKSIDTTAGVTIPTNASVAFPVGATVMITNVSASAIAIGTADTLRLAGTTLTGTRNLSGYGVCSMRKISSTVWLITGAGLS